MLGGHIWWIFVPASLALILAPGPDLLFLLAQGVQRGRAAGVATALGLSSGNLVHTLGAALGVSIIFRTSVVAFSVLKFLGALYLLYLAWHVVRGNKGTTVLSREVSLRPALAALYWRGVLMNVLNPKVALFFLAFLPQFVKPGQAGMAEQMVLLGLVFTLMVVLVFGTAGWFAGALRPWLQRRSARLGKMSAWLIAGVYSVLAVRLALVGR